MEPALLMLAELIVMFKPGFTKSTKALSAQ
jgi:hypothetical protein